MHKILALFRPISPTRLTRLHRSFAVQSFSKANRTCIPFCGYIRMVRHGESAANKDKVLTGQSGYGTKYDELTSTGEKDAKASAESMVSEIRTLFDAGKIKVVRLVSSTLFRCQNTQGIINNTLVAQLRDLGISIQIDSPDVRLEEINFGKLEGKSYRGKGAHWMFTNGGELARALNGDIAHPFPGGESYKDLVDRVELFCKERLTSDEHKDTYTVIVGHHGSLNALTNIQARNRLSDYRPEVSYKGGRELFDGKGGSKTHEDWFHTIPEQGRVHKLFDPPLLEELDGQP